MPEESRQGTARRGEAATYLCNFVDSVPLAHEARCAHAFQTAAQHDVGSYCGWVRWAPARPQMCEEHRGRNTSKDKRECKNIEFACKREHKKTGGYGERRRVRKHDQIVKQTGTAGGSYDQEGLDGIDPGFNPPGHGMKGRGESEIS